MISARRKKRRRKRDPYVGSEYFLFLLKFKSSYFGNEMKLRHLKEFHIWICTNVCEVEHKLCTKDGRI